MVLAGWYVPSRNRAAVLVFPGRTGAQSHARMLIAAGYGVLLLDRRGTGESDGEPNGWGWGSELDVHAAVEFLQHRPDVDASRIGGLGLSVGGELLLQAAAEHDGLRAVVSEGAGARSIGEFAEMDGASHWAMAPLMFSSTVATAVFSNQMPPPRLHELVPQIHVPVFFINAAQGQGGGGVEPELLPVGQRAEGAVDDRERPRRWPRRRSRGVRAPRGRLPRRSPAGHDLPG